MSSKQVQYIKKLIDSGNKAEAQGLLGDLLKKNPSADLWVLMAVASNSREEVIAALKKALELDEMHSQANRLLLKIEGSMPRPIEDRIKADPEEAKQILAKAKSAKANKVSSGRKRWRRMGCLSFIILNSICGIFLLGAIGLMPGVFSRVNQITGGPTPSTEIDGTPIVYVPNAPLLITPVISEPINTQDIEVLEHGYLHEYAFDVDRGDEVAIWVQFLSVDAKKVSRNVVLLNPQDQNVTPICDLDHIMQDGDNGITLICPIDVSGEWKVRILGRQGESVGVYFIGVQTLADI